MPNPYERVLLNFERLNTLTDLALLKSNNVEIYDRLTTLAGEALDTPVSLLSLVANNYQFFKSFVGLPEPWKSRRQTPLSHSFCQHVVVSNEPLIVEDAREHDLVKDNLAIPDLNVIGYLGMPLTLKDGYTLGSFCVIDGEPRQWTQTEIDIVRELSELILMEFEMRVQIKRGKKKQPDLQHLHDRLYALVENMNPQQAQAAFLEDLRLTRQRLNLQAAG